jgi:isopenicillin N synthase-like dioxygenase
MTTASAAKPDVPGLDAISFRRFETDFAGFAADLGASFERYGFAVVADHGIDEARIAAALDRTKAFFALPEAVKRAYVVPGGAGQRGFTPFGVETAKGENRADLKEFWHVGRDLPPGHRYGPVIPPNPWPDEVAGFREDLSALYASLDALGEKLLSAIARRLTLADNFFEGPTRDGDSVLRLLHYPPVSPDAAAVRAGAHEDINAITLLLGAEEAGLELLTADGDWLPVSPPAGSVVVNIGDMLQRLTNHRLPSTTHRVVNPAPERRGFARYSTPFFLHFAPDYLIQTLPNCVDPANPDRYPEPITARAYLEERLRDLKLT